MYAEIILPLPLRGTFTYAVPAGSEADMQTGSRVLVQFGKKKYYTGIVDRMHSDDPGYEVKPIMALLDPRPITRYPQLRLWKWISEYYLAPLGEVFKAAVPSGLKPESDTFVSLNEDFGTPEGVKLTERQALVVMLLEERKRMRVSEIESELKVKDATGIISRLLDAGIVNIDEKIVEKYHARKETYIELNALRGDHETLHGFFDMTRRSRQQEKTLIAYLDLSGWMSPNGKLRDVTRQELIKTVGITPGILKALVDKGVMRQEKRTINRFNGRQEGHSAPSPLSAAQQTALGEIRSGFRDKQTVMLHGVTGSGKTEIYSHLIASALHDGNQVLYLVPEISLTTQLTDRLRTVLGGRLLVYHSKFSDSERVDIWKRLLSGNEPLVVLGARSSVFLPFAHLGLVIVDEEHESSFKQFDPAPRYNARDTAMMLATMHGAKVLLGSATPSVETYYKALNGKYGLVTLSERYEGSVLPDVEIVDMRDQRKKKLNTGILSSRLVSEIRKSLENNRQAIIFQNRRGFAPVVVCRQCGWIPKCENCDVSLVYHKFSNLLKCHYCGFSLNLPSICPACGQNSIDIFGYGTERIAEEVHQVFPDSRVSRMDLDTTRNKDSHQEIIEEFARHDTDILVGTQMVTKGLDFERVSLVGILNADNLINFPDFRASERAFNMLEQVAGRAGRRNKRGLVIVQTSQPAHPILSYLQAHNYEGFYEHELEERRRYGYPPFTRVINIYLKHRDEDLLIKAAAGYAETLRHLFGNRILGPDEPHIARIQSLYIRKIMLKVEIQASMSKVKAILRSVYEAQMADKSLRSLVVYYDVDPM